MPPDETETAGGDGATTTVNLVTDVATADATVPDVKATAGIQRRLAQAGLAPGEHYLDSGYPSADLVTAAARNGTEMVTPLLTDHSLQAKAADGFAKSAFRIDWRARQARCPQGRTSTGWFPVTQRGHALRAGIEGTINQALDVTGIRRARYHGLPKVRLQHAFSATALNVVRLDAYWSDQPLGRARTSRLDQLAHKLAA